MRLNQHYGLNPILSKILYWFTGWCNVLDGLIVVLTGGYYYPMLAQRFMKVRMWFVKRKRNKMVAKQHKDQAKGKNRANVAYQTYKKKEK